MSGENSAPAGGSPAPAPAPSEVSSRTPAKSSARGVRWAIGSIAALLVAAAAATALRRWRSGGEQAGIVPLSLAAQVARLSASCAEQVPLEYARSLPIPAFDGSHRGFRIFFYPLGRVNLKRWGGSPEEMLAPGVQAYFAWDGEESRCEGFDAGHPLEIGETLGPRFAKEIETLPAEQYDSQMDALYLETEAVALDYFSKRDNPSARPRAEAFLASFDRFSEPGARPFYYALNRDFWQWIHKTAGQDLVKWSQKQMPKSPSADGSVSAPMPKSPSADTSVSAPEKFDPLEDLQNLYDQYEDHSQVFARAAPLAEQGNPVAQYLLAKLYYSGAYKRGPGGPKKNWAQAEKWFQRVIESASPAAAKGDPLAQFLLSEAYSFPLGGRDEAKAEYWLGKSVAAGYPEAIYTLSYREEKNAHECVRLLRTAAERGHARAAGRLGSIYSRGYTVTSAADKIPVDYAEAATWWAKAAKQGDRDSQIELALAYQFGRGVPKDLVEGYKWAALSAGKKDEREWLNRLASEMSPDQLAEAKKRIADFKREGP